jgi:hypothetical protein
MESLVYIRYGNQMESSDKGAMFQMDMQMNRTVLGNNQ